MEESAIYIEYDNNFVNNYNYTLCACDDDVTFNLSVIASSIYIYILQLGFSNIIISSETRVLHSVSPVLNAPSSPTGKYLIA